MKNRYLETGKIVGTHGVKGMARVQLWADSQDFLSKFKRVYTDKNGENKLEIAFDSPVNYVKERYEKEKTPPNSNGQNGIVRIRKPHPCSPYVIIIKCCYIIFLIFQRYFCRIICNFNPSRFF